MLADIFYNVSVYNSRQVAENVCLQMPR